MAAAAAAAEEADKTEHALTPAECAAIVARAPALAALTGGAAPEGIPGGWTAHAFVAGPVFIKVT